MRKFTLGALLALALIPSLVRSLSPALVAQSQTAAPLTAMPPSSLLDLPGSKLKGTPSQLAWSPDNSTLCLQTAEGTTAPLKLHYYLIRLKERDFSGIDVVPDWAPKYWEFKSARTAPGYPDMVIQVETKNETRGLATQSLSDKAKGRGMENAFSARDEAGSVIRVLTLKGEPVGRYVDQAMVPGITFSWSPQSLHAIAYANAAGHLGLMDLQGGKVEVSDSKDVLLPAWSPDGSQVVYLRKTGRHDYAVLQVIVSHP